MSYALNSHLKDLTGLLGAKIKGQSKAIAAVVSAVKIAESGLCEKDQPKASFLFLGPTGVGKTELALELVKHLYADSSRLFRFDMAEFQSKDSLGVLLGQHKQEQGRLGDAVDLLNQKGGGIILFDEIEKANPELTTIFLSLLDAARVTMSNGSVKDFSNTYIVFTSNLHGAEAVQMRHSSEYSVEKAILSEAQRYFRPELYDRFTKKVVFNRLNRDVIFEICKNLIDKELENISIAMGIDIELEEQAEDFLINKGCSDVLGVRSIRRTIKMLLGDLIVAWLETHEIDQKQSLFTLEIFEDQLKLIKKDEKRREIHILEKSA